VKVITGNSYILKMLRGKHLPRALNGRYLKKYYPSVWQDAGLVKADVLPSPLGELNGQCFAMDLSNFGTEVFFSMQALLKNKGECVDNQN
jgi:hypothetical protein